MANTAVTGLALAPLRALAGMCPPCVLARRKLRASSACVPVTRRAASANYHNAEPLCVDPVRSYCRSLAKRISGIVAGALRVNRSSGKGRARPSGVVLSGGGGVHGVVVASRPGIEPVCSAAGVVAAYGRDDLPCKPQKIKILLEIL